jgi:hypothetical protein
MEKLKLNFFFKQDILMRKRKYLGFHFLGYTIFDSQVY